MTDDVHHFLQRFWRHAEAAAGQLRRPFATPTVVTVSDNVASPRTLVCRAVNRESRELLFHTDARSAKAQALAENPALSACFYDSRARLQWAVQADVTLHRLDAVAEENWSAMNPSSRAYFQSQLAPGTDIDDPDLVAEPMSSQEHFLVVLARLTDIDALDLQPTPQRRAKATWSKDDHRWVARWVQV